MSCHVKQLGLAEAHVSIPPSLLRREVRNFLLLGVHLDQGHDRPSQIGAILVAAAQVLVITDVRVGHGHDLIRRARHPMLIDLIVMVDSDE